MDWLELVFRWVRAVLVVGAFCCILIAGGHGAGFLGLMLIPGMFGLMAFPLWLAVAALLFGAFLPWRMGHAVTTSAGIAVLVLAVAYSILLSERALISAVTALPFTALAVYTLRVSWGRR